jgi:hypothetical protein
MALWSNNMTDVSKTKIFLGLLGEIDLVDFTAIFFAIVCSLID